MCSQAVLSAYAPKLGMDQQTALKVSAAFGAGMGRLGEVCGAVTGAFMVIGLKFGRIDVKDVKAHEDATRLVREFAQQFGLINGSIICRDLLGLDLGTREGQKAFVDRKLRETMCAKYVRDAAEIVEQLIFK